MELNNLLAPFRRFFSRFSTGIAYVLGQKGAVWMNVEKPWIAYNTIPDLKKVIDKKASMFSNMKITLVRIDTGEQVEDKELMKLLENPNVLQGQNDFLKEYQLQKCVYGNQFIYGNRASSLAKYPVTLFNASPRYLKPILTGNLFDQVAINGIISEYQFVQGGTIRKFSPEEILYSKIQDIDNPIIGLSPIMALQYPISNVKLSYEFQNVLLSEKGAIGILSQDKPSKDSDGIIPMAPEERERIEKRYTQKYGIGKDQAKVLVTEASVKWQAMTYPTAELLLEETINACTRVFIDMYGLNQNIFSSLSGATYENVKQSLIMVYQDTIQPEADTFMQMLGTFLRIPEGTRLKASFDHLSILKENKLKGLDAIKSMIESFTLAIQSGLLDPVQAENILAAELGISVIDNPESKVITRVNRLSPLVANKTLDQFTINEIRDLAGQAPITGGDVIPVKVASGGPTH